MSLFHFPPFSLYHSSFCYMSFILFVSRIALNLCSFSSLPLSLRWWLRLAAVLRPETRWSSWSLWRWSMWSRSVRSRCNLFSPNQWYLYYLDMSFFQWLIWNDYQAKKLSYFYIIQYERFEEEKNVSKIQWFLQLFGTMTIMRKHQN